MNGKEFKNELAKQCKLTQKEAGVFIQAFIDLLTNELTSGGSLTLTGLGKFYTTDYNRSEIISPQGKTLEITPHKVARFKPSRKLKNLVASADLKI